MYQVVCGDLLESQDVDFIVHQCNCQRVMHGGFAKQISHKWPDVERADSKTPICQEKMGRVLFVSITQESRKQNMPLVVCNLYAQWQFGVGKRYTNYEALKRGFKAIANRLNKDVRQRVVVGIPYLIGCGLGGGKESVILDIIDEFSDSCNANIVVRLFKK